MTYTLGEAARTVGKSKSTIKRSIEAGRISAEKNAFGVWEIDPAELHRVYRRVDDEAEQKQEAMEREVTVLREWLEREREINRGLEKDRDFWRDQATGLLTDQRQPARPMSLWEWLFPILYEKRTGRAA